VLTAKQARKLLVYNKKLGVLFWKSSRGSVKAGTVAGTKYVRKHNYVRVLGTLYKTHRVIWLIVHGKWPSKDLDHMNGLGGNNELINLREATKVENGRNQKVSTRNTSGYTGVAYCKTNLRWRAYIAIARKQISLGHYKTRKEAIKARIEGENSYYSNFSRRISLDTYKSLAGEVQNGE
jgi:hypothetical protein